MRPVEIIIVYLACAAPAGVSCFLRPSAALTRGERLASAASAALLWPLVLFSHFTTRKTFARGINPMKKILSPRETRIDRAERALVEALRRLEDEVNDSCGAGHSEPTAEAARSACATVERYAGLTLAASRALPGGPPAESELGPARAAGRAGDDLETAGRCLHRRNVARLRAHQLRARADLLHALADLPDTFAASLLARPADFRASRRLFEALLPVYGRAIELLRLFNDATAVQAIARLFDDSAARLRRLGVLAQRDATEAPTGDEQCTPHSPQPGVSQPFEQPTQQTTLTRA